MTSHSLSSIPGTITDLEEAAFIQEPKNLVPTMHSGIRTMNIDTKDQISTMANLNDRNIAFASATTKDLNTVTDIENRNLRRMPQYPIIPSYLGVDPVIERNSLEVSITIDNSNQNQSRKSQAGRSRLENPKNFNTDIDTLYRLKRSFSEEHVRKGESLDGSSPKGVKNRSSKPVRKTILPIEKSLALCSIETYDPLNFFSDYAAYQNKLLHQRSNGIQRLLYRGGSNFSSTHTPKKKEQPNKFTRSFRKMKKSIAKGFCCAKGLTKKSCKGKIKAYWERLKKPFLPDNQFRLAWDIFLMLLVLFDMILLPLQLSFDVLYNFTTFEIVCDIIFVVDILVSFHTSYYHYGSLVTSHRKIAAHYARSWLIIDIIAAFPFYAIEGADIKSYEQDPNKDRRKSLIRLLRLFKVLKILRALKFFKLNKIFMKVKASFVTSPTLITVVEAFKLLAIVLLLAHWLGCGWHLVAVFERDLSDEQTWLTVKGLEDKDTATVYTYSLYWAITTMLTVGYGDITPATTAEVIYNIIAMLFGCAVFAYSLGAVSSIIQSWSQRREELSFHIYAVNSYMKKNHFSKGLQERVLAYMDHVIEEEVMKRQYSEKFLSMMPESLRKEIIMETHGDAINKNIAFYSNFNMKLINEVSHKMQEKSYYLDEVAYSEDTIDTSFYTVTKGKLGIFMHGEQLPIKTINVKDCFGEISFFSGKERMETVKSLAFSSAFYLEQSVFLEILDRHVDQKEIYHEICDKINVYNDYSPLKLKCLACDAEFHPLQLCPRLHYSPNPRHVLKANTRKETTLRENFVRRPRGRVHARIFSKSIEVASDKILEKYKDTVHVQTLLKVASPDIKPSIDRYAHLAKLEKKTSIENDINTLDNNLNAEIRTLSREESSNNFSEDFQQRELSERHQSTAFIIAEAKMLSLLASLKNKHKENFSLDHVKSFKNYFKHNNVENVLKRLNGLNKIGFLNFSGKHMRGKEILYFNQETDSKKKPGTLPNLYNDNKLSQNLEDKEKVQLIERLNRYQKRNFMKRSGSA